MTDHGLAAVQNRKATGSFVLGTAVYAVLLAVLAFLSTGFGEGIFFPLYVFFAPLSGLFHVANDEVVALAVLATGVLAWPAFAWIVRLLRARRRRTVGRLLLVMHYVSAVCVVVGSGVASRHENLHAFRNGPFVAVALLSVCVYAVGQVMIWRAVGRP